MLHINKMQWVCCHAEHALKLKAEAFMFLHLTCNSKLKKVMAQIFKCLTVMISISASNMIDRIQQICCSSDASAQYEKPKLLVNAL